MLRFMLVLVIAQTFAEGAWLSQSCQVSEWAAWIGLGNGTSTRARVILRYPSGSEARCPNVMETKVDCEVSVWTGWKPMGNGSSTRTRVVTRNPTSNGNPCPPVLETKVDCEVSLWTEWKPMGNGSSTRTRVVTRNPTSNGNPCPSLSETNIDCEVSEWSDWRPAAQAGQLIRSRTVIKRLTPQSRCPPLSETFDTAQLFSETTNQTGNRFANTFMLGGTLQSRLRKRQTQTASVRDLLIILDSSGSVPPADFKTTKQELGKLLSLLCPRPSPFDNTKPAYQQVALLVYSTTSLEIFDFKSYRSNDAIKRAINNAAYQGGNTCTDLAFIQAVNMFKSQKGARIGRSGVKQEVLIITDGQSNCGTAITAAKTLQKTADVYGLMVGNFGASGIAEVTSFVSPQTVNHLFQLNGFSEFTQFVKVVEATMNSYNTPCAPFDVGR